MYCCSKLVNLTGHSLTFSHILKVKLHWVLFSIILPYAGCLFRSKLVKERQISWLPFAPIDPWSVGIGRGLSWLRHWVGDLGVRAMNPITAITFSWAAIHFPTVYNFSAIKGQFLSYYAFMVCEVKDPLSW